jgi:hypothetical protein
MTETGISHSTPPVLTTIPIAVIPIIDAGRHRYQTIEVAGGYVI